MSSDTPIADDPRRSSLKAFRALLERDLHVMTHSDRAGFLAQALLQPIFFLFIFGRVLPEIGAAGGAYGDQLFPGVLALTAVTVSLQAVALPLVIEFSYTKEIEDRLLAPLPAWAVGAEKLVAAAIRGVIAAVLLVPLAALILPGGVDLGTIAWGAFAALLVAGSLAGAALGLVLGTAVPATRINVVFAAVLTPLLFTGATFYPWAALDGLRWFQVVTLVNPLTYVSEGARGALTDVPHLAAGWVVLGLAVSLAVFGLLGVRLFVRRAVS